MQISAGLYGFIIVKLPDGVSEPFAYDHDHTILLKDWYHGSTYEEAVGLSSIPFKWVGEPQVTDFIILHIKIEMWFHINHNNIS